MKEPILLHSCCAPCSSAILEWLLQNDYAPHVYYFNPNIFPEEEYLVRKNECIRYCEKLAVPFTATGTTQAGATPSRDTNAIQNAANAAGCVSACA